MMSLFHYYLRLNASVLLTATILLAPWFFRSNLPYVEVVFYALVLAATLGTLATYWTTPRMERGAISFRKLAWGSLPLLLGIILGFVQTLPLPESTVRLLSPGIEKKAKEFLPAPGSEEAALEDQFLTEDVRKAIPTLWPSSISVYPQATRETLTTLIIAALAFWSAGILFSTNRTRLLLWRLVAINGILLGLFVILTKSSTRLPFYHQFWPRALCGPFVNRNGMAGYLCLTLGPAFGLLVRQILVTMREHQEDGTIYAGIRYDRHETFRQKILGGIADFLSLFSRGTLLRLGACGVLFAAVAATGSRGGTLAAIFAFLLATLLFAGYKKAGIYLLPLSLTLLVALGFIFYLGMNEPIEKRLSTLVETDSEGETLFTTNDRLDNWLGALQTIKEYQGHGTGLGTYALANRAHDIALQGDRFFCFAENEAIEAMLTAGIAGLVFLLAQLGIFWGFVLQSLRRGKIRRSPVTEGDSEETGERTESPTYNLVFAFGIGMAFVLASQMVSGSFDFGLSLYPNAILFASLCGSFTGGKLEEDVEDGDDAYWRTIDHSSSPVFVPAVLTIIVLLVWTVGFFGWQHFITKEKSDRLQLTYFVQINPDQMDLSFFDKVFADYSQLIRERPQDATLHYQMAQAWILRFRFLFWQNLKRDYPETAPVQLWERSALEPINAYLAPFLKSGMIVIPRRFRQDPITRENLIPAMREILIARRLSPLLPEPHLMVALLTPFVWDVKQPLPLMETSLQRAVTVAPYEAMILFQAGQIQFLLGEKDEACRNWKQVLAFHPEYLDNIVAILNATETRSELCRRLKEIVGDQFPILEAALLRYPDESDPAYQRNLAKQAVRAVENGLDVTGEANENSPFLHDVFLTVMGDSLRDAPDKNSAVFFRNRARYNQLTGHLNDSVADYERAVSLDPEKPLWFYEYGTVLYNLKKADEAILQFSKAVELRPENTRYQNAVERARQLKHNQVFEAF